MVDRNNKIPDVIGMRALFRKELCVIYNFSRVFWELFRRVWSTYAIFTMLQIWPIYKYWHTICAVQDA